MTDICFYFQIHQPYRLRHYSFFDIGESPFYANDDANRSIMVKAAQKCYLPMNKLILKLIRRYKGKFKITFSISGTALDQLEEYAPKALNSFKELVSTGCAELLGETSHHSLSFLYSVEEFQKQVRSHNSRIQTIFGVTPEVFRNTSLIYNNDVAYTAEKMGFKGVLAGWTDHMLGWRSPNYLYSPPGSDIKLMLGNYSLSDDVSSRFSKHDWEAYPLTAEKYADWLNKLTGDADVINLFMNYETFGKHQHSSTGIFEFMEALPDRILDKSGLSFATASEAINKYSVKGTFDAPDYMSWAGSERDLSPWLGNDMQKDSTEALYKMENRVLASGREDLFRTWQRLQSSDHLYYMSDKWFCDGCVQNYFNPYNNPYDAYINYMNVLGDFDLRLNAAAIKPKRKAAAKKSSVKKPTAKTATKKTATQKGRKTKTTV